MQKISCLLGVFACTIMLAACGLNEEIPKEENIQTEEAVPKEEEAKTEVTEEVVTEEEDTLVIEESNSESTEEGKIYVADAAMYRGTVNSITEGAEGRIIELEQAEGTDFGAEKLQFLWTEDAKLSFEKEALEVGSYLEVFYGSAPGQVFNADEVITMIGANLYMSADMVNFNGKILEVQASETEEGAGSLFMKDSLNEQEVIFHYNSENTQIYADVASLKKGDQLNIFHRGIYTMSLPPQGSALEIRVVRAD